MALCKALRRDGSPCKAVALANSTTCSFHSARADVKRAVHRGRRRGGAASTKRRPISPRSKKKLIEIANPSDVVNLLRLVISSVLDGTLEPRRANSVVVAASTILNALQAANSRPASVEFIVHAPSTLEIPIDPCLPEAGSSSPTE